jgi:cytochrome P450
LTAQDDIKNPTEFDGFRYYKERIAQNKVGASSRFDYSSTDKDHLGFGHGKYACPGRFAASVEIKMLLAHVILQYDLKLPPGRTTRPQTIKLMEFKVQDSRATSYVRKRQPHAMSLADFIPKEASPTEHAAVQS